MERETGRRPSVTPFMANQPRARKKVEEIADPLPSNLDAERAILGAIILDNAALEVASKYLCESEFFLSDNRAIFSAMLALHADSKPTDLVTLVDKLATNGTLQSSGGAPYLASLVDGMPRVTNVEHYARIVREKAIRRDLIHTAESIAQRSFDSGESLDAILTSSTTCIAEIANSAGSGLNWRKKFHTPQELAEGDIDFLVTGLISKGVVFFGGLSGAGKSWLALSLARALTTGKPFLGVWPVPKRTEVLYLCPEMNERAFKKRLNRFAIVENFHCQTISDGAPLDLADPLLVAAVHELRPVVILDTALRFSSADDENSSSQNNAGLAKMIFSLLHLGAQAVVGLHHRSKGSAHVEELTLENALRGSSDLGAISDVVFGIQVDRGPGGAPYLKESRKLVRLAVSVVKARDFIPPEDFRIQLDPYIDTIGDFAVLTDAVEMTRKTDAERVAEAIAANPGAVIRKIAIQAGVHKDSVKKLANAQGWFQSEGLWAKHEKEPS